MSEEQTQNTETQSAPADTNEGNIIATPSLIEKADSIAKRMEEANKRAEELLERQESVAARLMLSGRSYGGTIQKTAEQLLAEKDAEEVKKALSRF
jgi:dienelactone hydrolase